MVVRRIHAPLLTALVGALLAVGTPTQAVPVLRTFDGSAASGWLGHSVQAAGDVDLDGVCDLILGAPWDLQGVARIVSGATGALLHELRGQAAGDGFGYAVAGVGDVDADGWPDLLVGACHDDALGVDAGSARVYSGRDFSLLRTLSHGVAGSQFGFSVAGAGDVDQDGHADVIVGAPWDRTSLPGQGLITPGSATVFSGATGAILFRWFGDDHDDRFGWAVDHAGDVDQDGWSDLVVGAPWDDNTFPHAGMARVFSSNPAHAQNPILWSFDGDGLGYELGTSVCGAGDVDQDGYDDVFVGQPEDKVFGDDAGSAVLFSGFDGTRLTVLYGSTPYSYYGQGVDAGDLDGDGVPDLVVGEPRHDVTPYDDRGAVHVHSGALHAAPQAQSLLFRCLGTVNAGRLGQSVAFVGDTNGDGFGDFVAGAPFATTASGAGAGRAVLWAGTTFQGSATTYGAGCPAATPLTLGYAGPVGVGQPLDILVGGGPAVTTLAWIVFGFDAGAPFPLDLGIVGLTGCTQYQHAALLAAVPMVGGAASLTLTVSPQLWPGGFVFFNQALALDPASPIGVRISAAGRVVMGQ